MNAPEKPFVCKSEGCKMSFTNEDHLMVHTKKHDMNLNLGLGMKTNIFVADQTPTPTRFIRNCEEVGLFQDLQNVNPFEETFRRATELVKSGNMTVIPNINVSSDDTLHTPHVFPLMNSNFNETQQRNDSPMLIQSSTDFDLKSPAIRNESLTDANSGSNDEPHEKITQFDELKHDLELEKIQNSMENDCIEVITMSGLINQIKSEEKQVNASESIQKSKKSLMKKAIDSKVNNTTAKTSTKQKLKANILKNKTTVKDNSIQIINQVPNIIRLPQTVTLAPIVQNPVIVNNPYILSSTNQVYTVIAPPVMQTLPQRSIKTNSTKKPINKTPEKKQNLSADEEQQQRIKVRNRAAQERARKKHKLWINNLVKQNETFYKTNITLKHEIENLKKEVAKLQTALIAHADCDVTKSSGNKSLIENLIKANDVTAMQKRKLESIPSTPESSTATMKKIRPNIKPLSLPTIALVDRNMVTYSNGSSTLIPQTTLVSNVSNVLVPITVQKLQNLPQTKRTNDNIVTYSTKLSDKKDEMNE